ncbi:hypothetical protein GCM10027570_04590 [Streptomonospora sediminis]
MSGCERDLPDLRDNVREEPLRPDAVPIRGGPGSAGKLSVHAQRMRRAFTHDSASILGVSLFAALDEVGADSFHGLLAGKLSTYRFVHTTTVDRLTSAGFYVLPAFNRPHVTVVLGPPDRSGTLMDLFGPPRPNPGYGETRRRRR